ncbi:MAG: DUF4105 domain-containing protein [Polyangiaceae bacterium]
MKRPSVLAFLAGWVFLAILTTSCAARAEPGDELEAWVLTMGPGDGPFEKFGHNAIWIHDRLVDEDYVYNFGTYAFSSSDLLGKFWAGRLKYWLSRRKSIEATVRSYQRDNRTVVAQKLDLDAEQKDRLFEALEVNLEPENRYYKYDYYLDNCSTRVRDAVDGVAGGALRQVAQQPARHTFRGHTLRSTADLLAEYLVLDAAMGSFIDRPIDSWAEMFLPAELQAGLGRARLRGADGIERPLVVEEEVLFQATRPDKAVDPPRWMPSVLVAGAAIGGALAGLGALARTGRGGARVALGSLVALCGAILGFLGCFYVFGWAATDHRVTWANENILQMTPWTIALAILGVGVALGRPRATRRAWFLAAAAAAAAALGALLKVLPWFAQDNWRIVAFCLPLWCGAAVGLWLAGRAASQAPAAGAPAQGATAPAAQDTDAVAA